METTNARQYVSPKTLAKILEVTPWTIRQWVIRGKIPAIKINARVLRFDLQEVGRALGMDFISPTPENQSKTE
jgi:excisionase family DNA binding protein